MNGIRETLRRLYAGDGVRADRFRYMLLVFELLVVAFFLVTAMVHHREWFAVVDVVIAVPLILDFLARMLVAPSVRQYFRDPITYADLVVVVSLLEPLFTENLAFLRVMRALRLFRSYRMQRELRRDFTAFRRNEEIIEAVINLVLFVFVVTAMVYVLQHRHNVGIENYMDALYYTVSTLTTTGFGDIVLEQTSGRLLSVLIMVFGVALFLRLMRAIFRTAMRHHRCPSCGLAHHEHDAVHCKACGALLDATDDDG